MTSWPDGAAPACPVPAAVTVALVDDHVVARAGMAAILRRDADRIAVVADVRTVDELRASPGWGADVVLLDLVLADASEVEDNVAVITASGSQVIMVSALTQPAAVRRALRAGALGFVPKDNEDVTELRAAVYAAAAGERFTSVALAGLILDTADPGLSQREQHCFVLYAHGMPMKSVARRVGVKEDTAKSYVARARDKYVKVGRNVGNRIEMYKRAVEDGHLPPG